MADRFNREVEKILFFLRERYPHEIEINTLKALTKLSGGWTYAQNNELVRSSAKSPNSYIITEKGIGYLRELKLDRLNEEQASYNRKLTTFTFLLAFGTLVMLLIEFARLSMELAKNNVPPSTFLTVLVIFSIFTFVFAIYGFKIMTE